MMAKKNNQIRALQAASQKKREDTLDKVNTTIKKMKEEGLPINIGSVAKLAEISRTWLYNNPSLKEEIQSYRQESGKIKRVIDMKSQVGMRENEIAALKIKNRNLKEVIKKLRRQLEIVYGELYKIKK